jgi:predicted aspartyl protease
MLKIHPFTNSYAGISRQLTLPVKISIVDTAGDEYVTNGIIDTGADGSVISQRIADVLGASPYSFASVNTASEQNVITPIYRANIELQSGIRISGLNVTSGSLMDGTECLIGMDILNMGDLAVTNFDGKTCVSFRIPSVQRIDFVDAGNQSKPVVSAKPISRNDQCPCGSGKKYKHCCGKLANN